MDSEQKAIILAIATLIVGLASIISEEYRLYLLVLYPILVVIYLISSYINKIEENSRFIREINKKLEIHERIARLEGKVFKWTKKGLQIKIF